MAVRPVPWFLPWAYLRGGSICSSAQLEVQPCGLPLGHPCHPMPATQSVYASLALSHVDSRLFIPTLQSTSYSLTRWLLDQATLQADTGEGQKCLFLCCPPGWLGPSEGQAIDAYLGRKAGQVSRMEEHGLRKEG